MCLIVTAPELLTKIKSWQIKFILKAGFDLSEFQQFGRKLDPLEPEIQAIRKVIAGRSDPQAMEMREKLDKFESYAKAHMPDPDKYHNAFLQASKAFPPPPSPYQRIDDHYLLCDLVGHIRNTTQVIHVSKRKDFVQTLQSMTVVTAPMGRCNAFVINDLKSNQYGIIIDDEILRLSVQIGYIVGSLVRLRDREIIWDIDYALEQLKRNSNIAYHYTYTIMAFLFYGSSIQAPPLTVDQQGVEMMLLLSQLSVMWCISHEMGHASLGHLHELAQSAGMVEEVELDDMDADISNEIEADQFADTVIGAVCDIWNLDRTPAHVSGAIILCAYRSIFQAIGFMKAPDLDQTLHTHAIREYTRHPSLQLRSISKLSPEEQRIEQFMDMIFEQLDTHLLTNCMNNTAKRLHPRWDIFISTLRHLKAH